MGVQRGLCCCWWRDVCTTPLGKVLLDQVMGMWEGRVELLLEICVPTVTAGAGMGSILSRNNKLLGNG